MNVQAISHRWSQEQLITGIRLGKWRQLLKRNGFQVSPEYFHRLAWITGLASVSSTLGTVEDSIYGKQIAEYEVNPTPLFILGHWRTGTTHLHNMLGRDPQNTFSTLYQVLFPDSFLTTGTIGPKVLASAVPSKRSYDNVAQSWFEAAEDEIGLMKLTGGLSFYSALMFPDRAAEYEKYIDFLEATPEERKQFKAALQLFVKKIMIATGGKRVIVKSCPHSARIRMILEVFPDAKFIHIHRHPARAFRSMIHMRETVDWENFFQVPSSEFIEQRWEHTATIGARLYTRLIEDRHLIPPGNLVELSYTELVGHERDVLKGIYEKFSLPGWDDFEAVLEPYLASLKGYQVNRLDPEPELEEFVYDRWRNVYDTYGYEKSFRA